MKRLIIHIFLSMLCFTAFATNKAILIGIGEYPEYTGWKTISSKNDIDLLQKALPSTYTIRTLINGEATHQNVVKTLKDITKQSLQGDTVFIHFSCHGQQMITNDSDEPDHLDEALIPFDASQTKSRDYDGHNHLTDNELGALLNSLRNRLRSPVPRPRPESHRTADEARCPRSGTLSRLTCRYRRAAARCRAHSFHKRAQES